ncbi:CHAP domain protein [compost metagenome]
MGADVNNTPAVGAIAIKPRDAVFTYGHAMVVEAVLGDGWVRVSQYNFAVNGQYSTMEIPASSVNYVHFR